MSFTIDEANRIIGEFKAILYELRKYDDRTDENGENHPGLITKLQDLYGRLNPTSIQFLGNLAREKAIESLEQIEEMLNTQGTHFQENLLQLEIFFENQKKDFEKKTFEIIKSLREETKTKVHELTANETNQFFNRLDEQTIDLFTKLEEFNNKRDTNYLYIIIATVVGIGFGIVIGLKV